MDQLAEYSWSHFCCSPLITSGSAGRVHSSVVSWHFCYSPLITRGSAGRVQLVTLLLLSTHHPWISWQRVTLLLLSTHHPWISSHWSHFCYSPLITRGSAGRVQLVRLLLLSTHHPWISWQSTAGHTSVTLHSSPVDQLAEYSWSHFCYSPLITRGSAGRVQLVTLLLLSTHVDQLAEYSWSHFCYSPLITRGSAGRVQLVTLLLLSTHNPWISWQSTFGHTSVTLHS